MPDAPTPPDRSVRRVDPTLLVAGLLQLAAMLAPAARVRILGRVSFFRLPTAGPALLALGVLTLVVALWPRGWWRWAPGVLSGAVLAIAYGRLVRSPSGTWVDPL